jgi:zinc protease
MNMKQFALILAVTLLTLLPVAAQEKPKTDAKPAETKPADAKPAAALPSVDDILDQYVKAVGGRDAVLKHTSRSMKGTFDLEAMNMSGPIESYAKAPNKFTMSIAFSGMGNFVQVFDGAKAWSSNPMEGLRELAGGELDDMKRRSDFHTEVNLKKQYSKMSVTGKEKVGGADAYVIEAVKGEGKPDKLYFDVASGLLVRQDSENESPQGKVLTESYMSDYKDVDGVKLAHTMRMVNPMFSATMKITEVKHGVAIEDTKFAKPTP